MQDMAIQSVISFLIFIFGDSPIKIVINSIILTIIFYVLWRFIIQPFINIIFNIIATFHHNKLSELQIIPPKQNNIDPLNTQNFFAVLQQLMPKHGNVSLEIFNSKKSGIIYRIIAPNYLIPSIQKHLASYIPGLKFNNSDIPSTSKSDMKIYRIKQSRHFAYPLKSYSDNEKIDPAAFIAGSMTRLNDNEEVTLQIITQPYLSRKACRIHNKLIRKGEVKLEGRFLSFLLAISFVLIPALLIGSMINSWQIGFTIAFILAISLIFAKEKENNLTKFEEQIYSEIAYKLGQPLLQTDIRFGVISSNRSNKITNEFISSLETLNTAGFQRLRLVRNPFDKFQIKYINYLFNNRSPSILTFHKSILNTSELATIFHFPNGTIRTEGVIRSHSKTLPAPNSLLSNPELDVVVGLNKHHNKDTLIGLTKSERERHMFIVGGTGSGKTTMLKYQIIQDIQNGKNVAVIDPHGDLAEEILSYIPKERTEDVIYLNPDDLDNPIGVNLLELPDNLKGNDLLREKDRITESVISVMRKIFSEDDSGGHRIEYILRNTIQTALTLEKPTLFTIFRLLNDGKFAKEAIKNLEDEDLKTFWKNELGKAGSMQKVKMAAGITSKIGRFLFSASARSILEQEKSTIDFDKILDNKILICNFSKGRLGEDTSMLFGVTILAKLQLAALKRSEKKQSDRKPFYIYVDEFQNFATLSFTQMLSEARKYKVYLTMAEQSTQQQDDQKLVDIILANVGTVIVFRTGSPKDEELLLPFFEPYIEKGEITNLSAYKFYCRISGVDTQEPMSGETIVVDDGFSDIEYIKKRSRKNYAIKQRLALELTKINNKTKNVKEQKQTTPKI